MMIDRAYTIRERIDKFCKEWLAQNPEEKALKSDLLTRNHWHILDRIHDCLATFEVATMATQGTERYLYNWYPTLSFMLDTMDDFKAEFKLEAAADKSFQYLSDWLRPQLAKG